MFATSALFATVSWTFVLLGRCYRHEPDSWLLTHMAYVSLSETITVLGIGQNRKLNERMTWQSQSAAKTAIVRERTLRRYFERPNGRAKTSEEVCWHGSTPPNTPSAPPLHHPHPCNCLFRFTTPKSPASKFGPLGAFWNNFTTNRDINKWTPAFDSQTSV